MWVRGGVWVRGGGDAWGLLMGGTELAGLYGWAALVEIFDMFDVGSASCYSPSCGYDCCSSWWLPATLSY